MRRVGIAFAIGLCLLSVTACSRSVSGAGTLATPSLDHPAAFAGTFTGELRISGGSTLPVVVTLFADGNVATSDGNDFEGISGKTFDSPGRGRWDAISIPERTYRFNVLELTANAKGVSLGAARIYGTGRFDESLEAISGVAHVAFPNGTVSKDSVLFTVRRLHTDR
ncbi:MAG TPA: hypothetical protein VF461_02515 [Gemmatimonadaceae bacterium]